MAEIKDCVGKNVKISKASITIKNEEGKTCGVVRNITSLYDLQPNKQMEALKIVLFLMVLCIFLEMLKVNYSMKNMDI